MSFSAEQAKAFIRPLLGKTATFIVDGRSANLSFAQVVMGLVAKAGDSCEIFDLDALYSSNADLVLKSLLAARSDSTTILVPEPGSSIEREFSRVVTSDSRVLIVDSMNTLHHLLSSEDGSSRSRKLSFAVASLSYVARTSAKAVIITMYRREGFGRPRSGRSISRLSDVAASVEVHGSELSVRCERGTAWPGGRFSIRIA